MAEKDKSAVRGAVIAGVATVLAAIIAGVVTLIVSMNDDAENTDIPVSYQGDWEGSVQRPDGTSQTVSLNVGPGGIGSIIGTINYDVCFGQIANEGGSGPVDLTARITKDPDQMCNPTARLRATLMGDQLKLETFRGEETTGTGMLTRYGAS